MVLERVMVVLLVKQDNQHKLQIEALVVVVEVKIMVVVDLDHLV